MIIMITFFDASNLFRVNLNEISVKKKISDLMKVKADGTWLLLRFCKNSNENYLI
jgi:hypothetical protein